MKRIALATSAKYDRLTDDDRLLLAPLAARGLHAEPTVWSDEQYRWTSFDAVVIRSCWDYHLQPEKFLRWIAELEAADVPIFNAPSLIRWNADKAYLRDLDTRGIAIVPTLWPEEDVAIDLQEELRVLEWEKAVIKPRISATAYRTELVSATTAAGAQRLLDELRRGPGVMVQKFTDTIATEGEWSLMFFAGEFCHAVLKKPKAGDFRVQNDFGGSAFRAIPPHHVLMSAMRAVQAVEPTVYARVDGVVDEGQFRLMELELIEPMLFLADLPAAPERFADVIAQALNTATAGLAPSRPFKQTT